MEPLVSILIPVYKVPEKYLRRCIDSAKEQTLKNIEIIIVDDGSPDCCGKICDEYALQDERIRVIHKKNAGLSAARNSAFDLARGKYITFLDGDDYLEKNACEVSYYAAIQNDVQLVFWDMYMEYTNKTVQILTMDGKEKKFGKEECKKLQVRVLDFHGHISQVYSKLILREFLLENDIRHIDELSQGAEGIVFNIQLFDSLSSAYYLPKYLLHYVYNDNSITHTPDEKNYYLVMRCFEYINEYIKKNSNFLELKGMLLNRVLYVAVATGISGYFSPDNKEPYKVKKEKYEKFLKQPLLREAIKNADRNGIGFQRKIILIFIRVKCFKGIALLGYIRKKQLKLR